MENYISEDRFISHENKFEKTRDHIGNLESKISNLLNVIWVIGVLAVIFGISGAFGYVALTKTDDKLTAQENKINELSSVINSFAQSAIKIREEQLEIFRDQLKDERLPFDNDINQLHKRIGDFRIGITKDFKYDFHCQKDTDNKSSNKDLNFMYGIKTNAGGACQGDLYMKTIELIVPKESDYRN